MVLCHFSVLPPLHGHSPVPSQYALSPQCKYRFLHQYVQPSPHNCHLPCLWQYRHIEKSLSAQKLLILGGIWSLCGNQSWANTDKYEAKGNVEKKPSRTAVHKNHSMSITDGKYTAFRQRMAWYRKQDGLSFATIPPKDNIQKKKKGWVPLIPSNFYEGKLLCTHTLRLLAPPFDQLCISHCYLDPVRLQKPPEAHFIQSSRVRNSTIPNYGVSQCKNLSFVAGICQGFSVSRWRSNRRKVHWSGVERKTKEPVKTRQIWIPIWQKDRNGINVKAFSV